MRESHKSGFPLWSVLFNKMKYGLIAILFCFVLAGCSAAPKATTSTSQPPTPLLTPTQRGVTPSPTTTPAPSATPFISITPLPRANQYRLRTLSQQETVDFTAYVDHFWEKLVHKAALNSDTLNLDKQHVAILAQEALLRYPNLPKPDDLQWQIAKSWAMAGNAKSSVYLARFLEKVIPTQKPIVPSKLGLGGHGFDFTWFSAPNLFGTHSNDWVLQASFSDVIENNKASGGAIFGVRQIADGSYQVLPIYTSWQPFYNPKIKVIIGDHTNDTLPEVIITQLNNHGIGFDMTETQTCIFQRLNDQWAPLLAGLEVMHQPSQKMSNQVVLRQKAGMMCSISLQIISRQHNCSSHALFNPITVKKAL